MSVIGLSQTSVYSSIIGKTDVGSRLKKCTCRVLPVIHTRCRCLMFQFTLSVTLQDDKNRTFLDKHKYELKTENQDEVQSKTVWYKKVKGRSFYSRRRIFIFRHLIQWSTEDVTSKFMMRYFISVLNRHIKSKSSKTHS